MRSCALLLCALVFATGMTPALAQQRGFGIGIIVGEPTGISAKGWVSSDNAVDVGLAWSFRKRGYVHIHADYLWHFPNVIKSTERFVFYTGLGGRFGAGRNDGILGVRLAGGIAWWGRSIPLEVFLELAPILDLVPATELSANGGIGIRYYFP
jgi:hypothetical protein